MIYYTVYREVVRVLLATLDPEGVVIRKRQWLNRRVYMAKVKSDSCLHSS